MADKPTINDYIEKMNKRRQAKGLIPEDEPTLEERWNNPDNPLTHSTLTGEERQWGMDGDTYEALGGRSPLPIARVPAAAADLALRGLQGLQAVTETGAAGLDDIAKRTGLDDKLSVGGNKFMPGSAIMALMEAFPAAGAEVGHLNIPEGQFAQYVKGRFEAGAGRQELDELAHAVGKDSFGKELDDALAVRDKAPVNFTPANNNKLVIDYDKNPRAANDEIFEMPTMGTRVQGYFDSKGGFTGDPFIPGSDKGKGVSLNLDPEQYTMTPVGRWDPRLNDNVAEHQITPEPEAKLPTEIDDFDPNNPPEGWGTFKQEEQQPEAKLPDEPAPEPIDPEAVAAKLTNALNNASVLSRTQRALAAEARLEKTQALSRANAAGSGEAGFRSELAQLKGELPKVDMEGVREQFSQPEIDSLFDVIKNNKGFSLYDGVNARAGLAKLLDGKVPNPSEIKLLGEVFPKDFVDAMLRHKSLSAKVMDFAGNAVNLPRSLMATLDLSAPLRQGVFMVGRPEFYKALPAMFKEFRDSFKANEALEAAHGSNWKPSGSAVYDEIRERPNYPLMEKAGLSITDPHGYNIGAHEENFQSQWATRIPGFGKLVKASEAAYSGFLNKLRADTFDSLVKLHEDAGIDLPRDRKALRDMAKFINAATGRGNFGKYENVATHLNSVFFSPRLIASRAQTLNPAFYIGLSPIVRKEALKTAVAFGGIALTVGSLAKMAGMDVEVDPRSSDFMKLKTGNTRYDILGGYGQYITLGARLVTNEKKTTTKGEVQELGKKFGADTQLSTLGNFFLNKTSPVASFVADYLRGQDAVGNDFDAKKRVAQMFVPLILQDMKDMYDEYGAKGPLMTAPSVFGVGVQNYAPRVSKKDFNAAPAIEDTPSTGSEDTITMEEFMNGEDPK